MVTDLHDSALSAGHTSGSNKLKTLKLGGGVRVCQKTSKHSPRSGRSFRLGLSFTILELPFSTAAHFYEQTQCLTSSSPQSQITPQPAQTPDSPRTVVRQAGQALMGAGSPAQWSLSHSYPRAGPGPVPRNINSRTPPSFPPCVWCPASSCWMWACSQAALC